MDYVPIIIGFALGILVDRYLKRLLDILEIKIPNFLKYCFVKFKNLKIRIQLNYSFNKLVNQIPERRKKSLDVILRYLSSDSGKKFASKHDVVGVVTSVCETGDKEIKLTSLKILGLLINMQRFNLKINSHSISIIINLLSDQDPEIRRAAMEKLVLLGDNGKQKDLLYAMIEERESYIEFQLSYLCLRLFQTFSPEIFINDQTIQPIFRFLKYNDDMHCLRFNLLGGFYSCVIKNLLKMHHIIDYDSNNCFKKILQNGAVDERDRVLSILLVLARSQEQKQIVDSSFAPLLIQNLQNTNNEIREQSRSIILELMTCNETKSTIENLIADANVNHLLRS
jgi:hypothetical protein